MLVSSIALDAFAHENPVASLSVSLPGGGCTLAIREDGTAAIFYGALPRLVRVMPGTFNFDQIVLEFRSNAYPHSDRSLHGEPAGTVSFPESSELHFINDAAFARSLLERAWKAREAPTGQFEQDDYRLIAKTCALADQEALSEPNLRHPD